MDYQKYELNMRYNLDLCNKIKELKGQDNSLYKLMEADIKKFKNSLLYKSPEQLGNEFYRFNAKQSNIIYNWIEENDAHDTEFALTLKEWINNYFSN